MSLAALTEAFWCLLRGSGRSGAVPSAPSVAPPRPPASGFEALQHILRLAAQCPSGPAGDDIRRATCELVEATTVAARKTSRGRILKAIAAAERRRARGRS